MRTPTLREKMQRLTWRVPILVLVYFLPSILGWDEETARPVREGAAAGLLIAYTAWLSTQGHRRGAPVLAQPANAKPDKPEGE
ncbi:MAG TPA: hypothetical protein VJ793_06670 [Anaerolineae bacterium]|nr:hypothetical protein [Anaerolineae bacterium]